MLSCNESCAADRDGLAVGCSIFGRFLCDTMTRAESPQRSAWNQLHQRREPERERRCATGVSLATSDGQVGILAGHAPLVAAIVPSVLRTVGDDGKEQRYAVGEGFLEVTKERVRVLVDSAERADGIDVERARKARDRAFEGDE
jgi:ATP synthase, Delta/Epsilon chain, beta-sandwich domain